MATVDESGLVTGVMEGRAAITAMAGALQGTSEITVANPDRAALVALYHATEGPNWLDNNNWLTDAPLGDWHGVGTDEHGRVFALRLASNGLTGEISEKLGNLASLTILVLDSNQLTGSIPPELGNLANLRELWLLTNQLTGSIPRELANLAHVLAQRPGVRRKPTHRIGSPGTRQPLQPQRPGVKRKPTHRIGSGGTR